MTPTLVSPETMDGAGFLDAHADEMRDVEEPPIVDVIGRDAEVGDAPCVLDSQEHLAENFR
jgi:hypothetical protein